MKYSLAIALVVGLVVGFIIGFFVGWEVMARFVLWARPGAGNGDKPNRNRRR